MKLIYKIDINNTPIKVFSWLGTPEKAMEWQSNVSQITVLHQTPDMIGTTFSEVIEEDGKSVKMSGVVTDYRKNELLAMHLDGKYNSVDVKYRLEDLIGRTHLIVSSNIKFKSFLRIATIVLWPVFKRKLLKQLNQEYSKLKALCEKY